MIANIIIGCYSKIHEEVCDHLWNCRCRRNLVLRDSWRVVFIHGYRQTSVHRYHSASSCDDGFLDDHCTGVHYLGQVDQHHVLEQHRDTGTIWSASYQSTVPPRSADSSRCGTTGQSSNGRHVASSNTALLNTDWYHYESGRPINHTISCGDELVHSTWLTQVWLSSHPSPQSVLLPLPTAAILVT